MQNINSFMGGKGEAFNYDPSLEADDDFINISRKCTSSSLDEFEIIYPDLYSRKQSIARLKNEMEEFEGEKSFEIKAINSRAIIWQEQILKNLLDNQKAGTHKDIRDMFFASEKQNRGEIEKIRQEIELHKKESLVKITSLELEIKESVQQIGREYKNIANKANSVIRSSQEGDRGYKDDQYMVKRLNDVNFKNDAINLISHFIDRLSAEEDWKSGSFILKLMAENIENLTEITKKYEHHGEGINVLFNMMTAIFIASSEGISDYNFGIFASFFTNLKFHEVNWPSKEDAENKTQGTLILSKWESMFYNIRNL